jgi:hypothetical protein
VSKEQEATAFEVFTLFGQELLLNTFSDILKSPCTVTDDMKTVNDNGALGNRFFAIATYSFFMSLTKQLTFFLLEKPDKY